MKQGLTFASVRGVRSFSAASDGPAVKQGVLARERLRTLQGRPIVTTVVTENPTKSFGGISDSPVNSGQTPNHTRQEVRYALLFSILSRELLMSLFTISTIAMSNGLNALRQYGHIRSGMCISRPSMIYATINERCNLRCKYCNSWKSSGEGELSTETWLRSLDELLSWTKRPKLNFSGGEPFMREDMSDILEFSVKKGALTGVVTNGYTLTPKLVPRVAGMGLSNINISIDSLDPTTFDYIRAEGREGHTGRVIESIQRIVKEIRRQGTNTKVFLKTVVCGTNVDSLVPLVKFAEENGITGITFQPLQAVFGDAPDLGDVWYKQTPLWPKDPQPMADAAEKLIELKNAGAPIMNPEAHIASWESYFKDPIHGVGGQIGSGDVDDGHAKTPCRIGHTHLYLGAKGDIHLCWDYPSIGNIANNSIPTTWTSNEAEELRDQIAKMHQALYRELPARSRTQRHGIGLCTTRRTCKIDTPGCVKNKSQATISKRLCFKDGGWDFV